MSFISESIERKRAQQPQFDYMFRVELPDLGQAGFKHVDSTTEVNSSEDALFVLNGLQSNNNDGATIGSSVSEAFSTVFSGNTGTDNLNHRVYAISAPHVGFDPVRKTFGSGFMKSAGNHTIDDINLTIDELEDGDTLRYLTAWQALIKNADGTYNPPALYKRDLRVVRMSQSSLGELTVSVYRDVWPISISATNFNYDSNAVTQYTVTLSCHSVDEYFISASEVKSILSESNKDILKKVGLLK